MSDLDVIISDYRYKQFDDVLEPIAISGETHIIPSNSPYEIRLNEVPVKESPSSISLTIAGVAASEVAATPAAGEFWADYNTGADGDDNWNTGTIQFNSADAGKTVVVNYSGMGTLVDKRVIDAINAKINATVSVTSGTIAHGGTIPLPSGYTRTQCKYAVWCHAIGSTGTYNAKISKIQCQVNQTTGLVVAQVCFSGEYEDSWVNGTAGYLCVGVK